MKILMVYFCVFIITFSFDYNTEIDGEINLKNNQNTEYITKAKITGSYQENNVYSEISVSADTSEENNQIKIYRAYTELYKDKFALTLGKQKIVWGSAYLFNMSDVINEPDPENPKSEKIGVNAIKFKYNTNDMSRMEIVGFSNDNDNNNFAARYTFLISNFEFMFNYFDYNTKYKEKKHEVKTGVLEFKGEIWTGIWSQIIFQKISNENNFKYVVLGSDYSFQIKNSTIYILSETIYNSNDKNGGFYLHYNYSLNENVSFGQSYLSDYNNAANVFYNNLSYLFNDYVTLSFGINFYKNSIEFSKTTETNFEENLKNEIYFKISSVF